MTSLSTQFFPPESGPLAFLTKPAAVLRLDPGELSERLGINFQTAHDDLDTLEWARVVGLSGKPYALVHHRNSPKPGTQIVIRYDSNDPWADVLDVLKALNLSEQDLAWRAPDVASSPTSAASGKNARHAPSRPSGGKLLLKLSSAVATQLRKVHGRGPFHTLLRNFDKRVKDRELELTPADVERLLSYSATLGTTTSGNYAAARKSSKKASRKK